MATPIHLIIEAGPDRGREFSVPSDGARAGRSSANDISLADPVASRFHCRFFWTQEGRLAVADLGSSNTTEVNRRAIGDETALTVGDRIVIGDTTIKVVADRRDAPAPVQSGAPSVVINVEPQPAGPGQPPPSAAEPEPTIKPAAAAQNQPPLKQKINQTFRRFREAHLGRERPSSQNINQMRQNLIIAVVVLILLFGAIWAYKWQSSRARPAPAPREPIAPADASLGYAIEYEKVEASTDNIFRYYLTIAKGSVAIQIDDLKNNRHVPREKEVDDASVSDLLGAIENAGFFDLMPDYQGVNPNLFDQYIISVTIGRKTHKCQVVNRLEPDGFKTVREMIEEFGRNELGLAALALPPEKLLLEARNAFQQGRKLLDEREVKPGNLAAALRSLREAEWYLETLEPKPDIFADIVAQRGQAERDLEDRYNNLIFLADKAIKLRDWMEAARQLRLICDMIPDRADKRNKESVKKLLDVERRLGPRRG